MDRRGFLARCIGGAAALVPFVFRSRSPKWQTVMDTRTHAQYEADRAKRAKAGAMFREEVARQRASSDLLPATRPMFIGDGAPLFF